MPLRNPEKSALKMEDISISRASAAHIARLDWTLRDLQSKVKEQEAALEKLQLSSRPISAEISADPQIHLNQLRILTTAYETLTPKGPYLPSAESALPSLLALRMTHKTIQETKLSLTQTHVSLMRTEQKLEKEETNLNNANLISRELEERMQLLRKEIQERTQKSPTQVAKDMIRELKKRRAHYETDTGKMVKAFNKFVDNHLAAMLAAEELGGPVVGGVLHVEELDLEAGFNNQGKAKRRKSSINEDKRQQRIDQIWGEATADGLSEREPRDEKSAAAAEMRDLTEQLLNALVEAEGGEGDSYVELQRESAVARFLVRAKVAQFHPRDAWRLRLIDFGRDLEE